LSDGELSLDYAGLARWALAQAARMRQAGIGPGDVVGVACDRSAACVVGMLATLCAGAAYLPLDLAYPPTRLAQMAEDARPRLLLIPSGAAADASGLPDVPVMPVERLADETVASLPVAVDESAPAYVLFTSGSTGRPKGAVLSRRALGHMVAWHLRHPRLGAPARTLQFVALGFDASVRDLFATFATGGSLLLAGEAERQDPFRLLETLRAQRIERASLPYVGLRAIANAHAEGGALPETLRDLMTGGEAMTITPAIRRLFAALPEAVLYNEYGPTEACVLVTSRALTGDPAHWPERPDIGAPLDHVQLLVADEQQRVVPDGIDGELLIGGPSLADGYIGHPAAGAGRFVSIRTTDGTEARVYRSGDRVRREADGRIVFLGRDDDQVKIAGHRVELGEIEAALTAHALVRGAAVVPAARAEGQRLLAYVVPAPDAPAEAELRARLIECLAASLPAFARPHELVFRETLPLTPNGKVDRRRLREESAVAAASPPATATDDSPEQRMLSVWRELLARPGLCLDDNVFDFGADSLLVMHFVTRLRAMAIDGLGAPAVYEFPTARQQARALAGAAAQAPAATRGAIQRGALAQLRNRHRKVNG
jgi:amino acid adenylation domain-containing protein